MVARYRSLHVSFHVERQSEHPFDGREGEVAQRCRMACDTCAKCHDVHGQAPSLYPLVVMEEMKGFPCLRIGQTDHQDL